MRCLLQENSIVAVDFADINRYGLSKTRLSAALWYVIFAYRFLSCENAVHYRNILVRGFARDAQDEDAGSQSGQSIVLVDPIHVYTVTVRED